MSLKNLDIYLNDHLAGSVGALELLDHLKARHSHEPLAQFLSAVRDEISEDQERLLTLMSHLEIKESEIRKAGAWIADKIARIKLRLEGEKDDLGLLQGLEALAVGIVAKAELWKALAKASASSSKLRVLDFLDLEARATDQYERVEGKRIELASHVLSTG